MGNSIQDQLTNMENKIVKYKGQLVKATTPERRQEIQANINAIQAEIDKVSPEDIPVEDIRPVPKKWVKVTMEQIEEAQKAFTLYGFDPKTMTALIRNKEDK